MHQNPSKSIDSLTTNPFTTEIRLISIVEQILRHWIQFLATNTPHFSTFHTPSGAHPAVKRFVATGALVGGFADVHARKPAMIFGTTQIGPMNKTTEFTVIEGCRSPDL